MTPDTRVALTVARELLARSATFQERHDAVRALDKVLKAPDLDGASRAQTEWQPISTAPKDGSPIILSNGLVAHEGHWFYDEGGTVEHRDMEGRYIGQDDREGYEGWMDWGGGMLPEPTHWMPVPSAPATPGETK